MATFTERKDMLQYHGTWKSRISLMSPHIPDLTLKKKPETRSLTLQQCCSDISRHKF